MELDAFKGQKKNELSMIEVAHAILEQKGDVLPFADLVNAIQKFLGESDEEVRNRLSQFYTDLNVDGSFISLGENVWGLRSWYPFDSVDEEVNHPEDEEDQPQRKRRKKVNAFLADVSDDDDVIDYNDDDPEDNDDDLDDEADYVDDEGVVSDHSEQGLLADADDNSDDAPDENLPDGIEGELAEFDDDDIDDDDDFVGDDDADDDDDNE
ncbi:DNA-directed RNA polymerase subunit delta [Loigolactobacillus zhaoyuanensis]|uniref:DNA-directed RNA polymerase subunit delta n=1 Tax=Loigolactobacillus zhaoyuanensis TaxID=2486017 RepID=UPI00298A04E6|nr:DNA-directed RNA polymerase subunit delta [Loigolactobacillus zhaoyuanensis]